MPFVDTLSKKNIYPNDRLQKSADRHLLSGDTISALPALIHPEKAPKQTQNKPKTNPKQTQNKPKQTENKGNVKVKAKAKVNAKDNAKGNVMVNAKVKVNVNANVKGKEKEYNKSGFADSLFFFQQPKTTKNDQRLPKRAKQPQTRQCNGNCYGKCYCYCKWH